MSEFLFEVLSEEIPSLLQENAAQQWQELACSLFGEYNLSFQSVDTVITPRRLTICLQGIPVTQTLQIPARRGPRVGCTQAQLEGFLRANQSHDCVPCDYPAGQFWTLPAHQIEQDTAQVLPMICQKMLADFSWPQSMRWGRGRATWVRPIRRLLALWAGQPLPFIFDPDGEPLKADNLTQGHRFLSPDPFTVCSFQDYQKSLKARHVMLRPQDRRTLIRTQLADLVQPQGWESFPQDTEPGGLLDEVAGLVEWPVVYVGRFDPRFLDLPLEVITTPMRVHQRYFPLRDCKTQRIVAGFGIVMNQTTIDQGATAIAGHERVLRARLSDALFFWTQDTKTSLESMAKDLHKRVFFDRLGSLEDKTQRLKKLAQHFFPQDSFLQQAASLSKADLMSVMVSEFPELQGLMGTYYARHQGWCEEAARALFEHYWPHISQKDPPGTTGCLLGVLDRIDTLVGFFALGLIPKGSQDPLALRRAGNALVQLLLLVPHTLSIPTLVEYTLSLYQDQGFLKEKPAPNLAAFLQDRLRHLLHDEGLDHQWVEAALDARNALKVQAYRARHLHTFSTTPQAQDMLAIYRRIAPMISSVQHEQERITVCPTLFTQQEEKELWQACQQISLQWEQALQDFANLRPWVDRFFSAVTVHVPQDSICQNRLALVTYIYNQSLDLAQLEKIKG